MPRLIFPGSSVTPNNFTYLFWRRDGEAYAQSQVVDPTNPDFSEMLNGLFLDQSRRFYFRGFNELDGVRSLPSEEISRVFTLRATPEEPDRPDAPDLTDLAFDIVISEDDEDPDFVYHIEVSS